MANPAAPTTPPASTAPELELPIGGDALVEVTGTQKRFKTSFVGMDRRQYILLKLPMRRQIIDMLTPHLQITVRFLMDGGRVCGFQCHVAHLSVKPFPLLFLSYPKLVEVLKLRKHDRVACFQPIVFYLSGEEYPAVIVNISAGGCRILMEEGDLAAMESHAPGEQIVFQLRLFGSEEHVYLQGTVKTATNEQHHGKQVLALGVAFQDLDEELAGQINSYVETMLAYQQF